MKWNDKIHMGYNITSNLFQESRTFIGCQKKFMISFI